MAIYKRYNTRKRRLNRTVLACILTLAVVFAATAIFGAILGNRAEGLQSHLPTETSPTNEGVSIDPLQEHAVHAEYAEPAALAAFTSDDPDAIASTWIYRDGSATFHTAVDAGLGKDVGKLPSVDAFSVPTGCSGVFAVRSIYADAAVRDILYTYETALLNEYAATSLSEVVLLFERMDADTMADAFSLADSVQKSVVLCVPYAVLHSEFAPRFFSEATERGYALALLADADTKKTLTTDTEDYAFSFTRYQLRLVLEGKDADLVTVLAEKDLLNYQFISPREN